MVTPEYDPHYWDAVLVDLIAETTWVSVTPSRHECFMSASAETYTYGSGPGARTYSPVPYTETVAEVQRRLNRHGSRYNVCFLNRYDDEKQQLGWHADDSPGMNHDHPIAVVSFGQPREIWWRENGQKGVIPPEQRQLLASGSLFVMPPGFQRTHQHRIPKGDRAMTARVSLTFREYRAA